MSETSVFGDGNVSRQDDDAVRVAHQHLVKGIVLHLRALCCAFVAELQFRATDGVYEQGVPGDDGFVVDEIAGDLGGVTGRGNGLDIGVSDLNYLVSVEGVVLVFDAAFAGAFAEVVRDTELVGERAPAGDVVGVDVGVEHVSDFVSTVVGRFAELVGVSAHVDSRRLPLASDEVTETSLRTSLYLYDFYITVRSDGDVIVHLAPLLHAAGDDFHVFEPACFEFVDEVCRRDSLRTDCEDLVVSVEHRFDFRSAVLRQRLVGTEREVPCPSDMPRFEAFLRSCVDEGEVLVSILPVRQLRGGYRFDHVRRLNLLGEILFGLVPTIQY